MKVDIPSPCSADWSKMKIGLHSRFCSDCSLNVMDFTTWSKDEILAHLLSNHGKRVCGRIRPEQLDYSREDFLITIQALSKKQNNPNIAFYLLAMGSMLLAGCGADSSEAETVFSKKMAQTAEVKENDEKVSESSTIDWSDPNDFLIWTELPKHTFITGDCCAIPGKHETGGALVEPDVYQFVEKMPNFPGGMDSLVNYIKKNLNYPKWEQKKRIEGVVYASMIVRRTGEIERVQIKRSVPNSKNFDTEVIRVISEMPRWVPGEEKGRAVDVFFTIPIKFKL